MLFYFWHLKFFDNRFSLQLLRYMYVTIGTHVSLLKGNQTKVNTNPQRDVHPRLVPSL